MHALNSDHLPILLTIQTDNKHTIQQNRRSYTNYRKADWYKFTQGTEDAFSALQPPTDIHDANKTFTNILYQAGKKYTPVGRIRNTDKLLPQDNKIRHRNWTSKNTPQHPSIPELNKELQTTQPTSGGAVTADSSCCANCVEPPRPQQWVPDLPFFGHADPLDGWRCCSQKRVMSRPIQVRQL